MSVRSAAFASVLLAAAGCSDDAESASAPGPSCSAEAEPSVRLHRGLSPYDAVATGDVLDVEYGSQGGMHLRLAISCAGLDPGSPTLEEGLAAGDLPRVAWEVTIPSEVLTTAGPRRAVRLQDIDGRTLLEPQLVVFRYFESPPSSFDVRAREAELEAQPASVAVTVTDRCDRTASASAEVELRFPRDGG